VWLAIRPGLVVGLACGVRAGSPHRDDPGEPHLMVVRAAVVCG
jgi:hypothetical protein